MPSLDSAVLFTPGRASYISSRPDGSFPLNLTEASAQRADKARQVFDPGFHTTASFAGGYPAIANWPAEHIPPLGEREADLMAMPLVSRLLADGWTDEAIRGRVLTEGESSSSLGDVAISMQKGLLNINDFHSEQTVHGLELVTGKLHGIRFRDILTKGLNIDPGLIRRVAMHDRYGKPATEFSARELSAIAVAKEVAGIFITRRVLRDVRPGNPEDLLEAEQRFNQIASRYSK